MTVDENSPIVVESSRFHGDVVEVILDNKKTGQAKRFVQCPSAPRVAVGDRVAVRIVLLMLVAMLLGACSHDEPAGLMITAAHTWSLPSDGPRMPQPRNITIDKDDNVIVLDTAGRVLVFDEVGRIIRQWRMPTNEAGNPEGACALRDGRIAVADTHYSRIVMFDRNGKVQSMFGERGAGLGQFEYPAAIVQDDEDNLYICEYGGNDRVQKFTPDGTPLFAFGANGAQPGQFQRAGGMVFHKGRIYVADAINNRVQVFDKQGKFIEVLGAAGSEPIGLHYPYDLCVGPDDLLYVVEYGAARVTCMTLAGELRGRYGSPGVGAGQLSTPWGIGVDSKMRIRVADTGNHRIVELQL